MRNLKFKLPPTVGFLLAAVNHNIEFLKTFVRGQSTDRETQKPTKIKKNGSKPTNHSEERDLLVPLNSISSFPETHATLIDGSEKRNCW